MRLFSLLFAAAFSTAALAAPLAKDPTWWDKYTYILNNGPDAISLAPSSSTATNVDVSNECGPQSETFIAINPSKPRNLAAGSNEIYRLQMRGYFSTDNGSSWGGVDLPLPPPIGANGVDFGSDPTLAFDTFGNLYYGYIVVYFSNGKGVNGSGLAVARSTDGGKTYPQATFFAFNSGSDHFNDKPMITTDNSAASPYQGNVYIAWDAASGGSATGGGMRVAVSSDHGKTFSVTRADDPSGPGRSIGATITTGPQGQVYLAWNDYSANAIMFNSSLDGGATWGTQKAIAYKTAPFDVGVPAEQVRRALVYPACAADISGGAHRGRINCSWMDVNAAGNSDIYASVSDDGGATWTAPATVAERLGNVDRFNHWLAADPVTGQVAVSYYDTRNDTTGARYMTDVYLSRGDGVTFGPSVRVSDVSSNEHDCNGLYPCPSINYGNQQGDYEGVASYGGTVHAIWTDSRRNTQQQTASCGRGRGIMEEVFTATVK